jgi:hypothetical protein
VLFGIDHCRTLFLLAILMQIMYNGKNDNTAYGFENWLPMEFFTWSMHFSQMRTGLH